MFPVFKSDSLDYKILIAPTTYDILERNFLILIRVKTSIFSQLETVD